MPRQPSVRISEVTVGELWNQPVREGSVDFPISLSLPPHQPCQAGLDLDVLIVLDSLELLTPGFGLSVCALAYLRGSCHVWFWLRGHRHIQPTKRAWYNPLRTKDQACVTVQMK
jgi:hypothetical protein